MVCSPKRKPPQNGLPGRTRQPQPLRRVHVPCTSATRGGRGRAALALRGRARRVLAAAAAAPRVEGVRAAALLGRGRAEREAERRDAAAPAGVAAQLVGGMVASVLTLCLVGAFHFRMMCVDRPFVFEKRCSFGTFSTKRSLLIALEFMARGLSLCGTFEISTSKLPVPWEVG